MQAIIETHSLSKSYGGRAAVDKLDMTVPKGEIYGFIGQNGAGKSTTFKLLAGLAHPTGGSAEIFGKPLGDAAARRRTGILIEDAGVYPGLSAMDNCLLKADALGLPDGGKAAAETLEKVGLDPRDRKKSKKFSMGQRRRLGLALALLGSPDLLLLDEPTNGLDPQGIRDVRALLLDLQQQNGVTIVISSHILGELEKIATCYGVICKGRMVKQFTAGQLSAQCRDYIELKTPAPQRAAVVLEQALGITKYEVLPEGTLHIFAAADPAAITAALAKSEVAVQAIGTHRQELEDYFLQLMGVESNG